MRGVVLLVLFSFFLASCTQEKPMGVGKWYTYAESGDYMELWIGEREALSYLSSIDEFLLYGVSREGSMLHFQLKESRIIDAHVFDLDVLSVEDQVMKTMFLSESRVDSLKTYFMVDQEIPVISPTLEMNRENMNSLLARMEGSHAGHGH